MSIYEFDVDDARRFASEQGIAARVRGKELQFSKCPYCRNRTDDKNTFAINLRTGQFKCLRATCGAHGNMITLAKDFNFSLGRDVDEYYNRQRKFKDMARYPRPVVRQPAVDYLEARNISRNTAERYSITTQTDHENILVFPFFDEEGKMQFAKYRKMDFDKTKDANKEWCEANCKPILFGMDQCDMENPTLILTEGQIDSLSVAESGIPNAVSVPTGAKGFTWVPYCWDFLNKFETLIIFGDYENGQITLLEEMKSRFKGTVKHVRPEDYHGCKDANELLQKFGRQTVRDAVNNSQIVEHPRIKKLAEVKRKSMADMEHINTGIAQLNKMLGGFYFGQLIILTGERGLGKSTLGSQFMTYAIEQGCTGFYYSGELMDWFVQDWFDRQIAGSRYINCSESSNGYRNYLVDGDVLPQIHDWYNEKCYIFDNAILNGNEEQDVLLETVKTAIRQYGCRVLLLDNLMTAIEDDPGQDIYRQQSNFVRNLAEIAKGYNVIILLVVHPRKQMINKFSNDDIAGSSNITNLADVILRYTRPDKDDEDDGVRPDRVLQVTKNRVNGHVDWKGINLWYEEASKRITEKKGEFSWIFGWDSKFEEPDDELGDIPF